VAVQIPRREVAFMRKVIVFAIVVVVAAVIYLNFVETSERSAHDSSPAFQAMLDQAVDRLEGVPERIAETAVSEAQADPQEPTVDEYTCAGFRTCDAIATCDGSQTTCDGEITCDYSTCMGALTCTSTCEQYTIGESATCDGSPTCHEGCAGWPTYDGFNPTCVGGPTCEVSGTCIGFVTCSGCGTATERTTWGSIKAEFGK
jgi:hypothetical protein